MKKTPVVALGLLAALLTSYCGAGSPQTEAVRDDATLALWDFSTASDEAREQLADGIREFDMRRMEAAYAHLQRAIAADPQLAIAEVYAAAAATQAGTTEGAFAHIRKASQLSANASPAVKLLAEVFDKSFKGDDEGAIASAKKLVELDPTNPRSLWVLGYMHDFAQQPSETRTALEKAIEVAPGFLAAYTDLSQVLTQREPADPARAEMYARKALELAPNESQVYDVLGDALRMQGKLAEAAQAYTKGAELDPSNGGQLQQRGHVNTFLGRFAEARADYDAAVNLESGNRRVILAMYRSLVHMHENNPKGAVDELEKLYASIDGSDVADPTGMKVWLHEQAMLVIPIYTKMVPESESAVKRYEAERRAMAAKINTPEFTRQNDAAITAAHGFLAFAKGDYAAATRSAAKYMELRAPDNSPAKNQLAHELLGIVAFEQKRYAEAIRELSQAGANNMIATYYRGRAHEALGQLSEAEQMYQKIASYYLAAPGAAVVRNEAMARLKKIAA